MIKKLQLRGITRSPSDKVTPDGGCAESLNIHIDEGESAPTMPAEDLADKLGWEYPSGDYLYIHKGLYYTNFIFLSDGKLKSSSVSGETLELYTLNTGETVNDISHIGNTIVLCTNQRIEYILFRDGEYVDLGDRIPIPKIEFKTTVYNTSSDGRVPDKPSRGSSPTIGKYVTALILKYPQEHDPDEHPLKKWSTTKWASFLDGTTVVNDDDKADYDEINNTIWEYVKSQIAHCRREGYFAAPAFVRYALRLYDNSYIYHSVPILLGATIRDFIQVIGKNEYDSAAHYYYSYVSAFVKHIYQTIAYLKDYDYDGWDDIVTSIDIFLSTDIYNPAVNSGIRGVSLDTEESTETRLYYNISFTDKEEAEVSEEIEREVLSKTNFYKIASFKVNGVSKLVAGYNLLTLNDQVRFGEITWQDYIITQDELPDDYQTNHKKIADKVFLYNNRSLLLGTRQEVSSGYCYLNGTVAVPDSTHTTQYTYKMKFYLRDKSGEEKSVHCRNDEGGDSIPAYSRDVKIETSYHIYSDVTVYARPYGWIAYPDSRCYIVEIIRYSGDTVAARCRYTMEAHPGLNCSYCFIGFGEEVAEETNTTVWPSNWSDEDTVINEGNIVWASLMDNPFVFPLEGRIRFNSEIIGVANATVALSEGQFGEFPLYVFTKDEGIWAIPVSDTGNFVGKHPVTRHTAISDNIIPVEQAVVFITDKGVNILQGSQVTNISPDMNGRHYVLEDDVEDILNLDTNWSGLISAVTDNTPFMAFMRDAEIAYDYKGGRLIFFNDNKPYQYVYMLGTQTWHKLAGSLASYRVLNSYPDCYVTELSNKQKRVFRATISEFDADDAGELINARVAVATWLNGKGIQISATDFQSLPASFDFDDDTDFLEFQDEYLDTVREEYNATITVSEQDVDIQYTDTTLYDYSTTLDDADVLSDTANPIRGIIVTRPFDLGEPDIRKTIRSIRIRGKYNRDDVQYILCGSLDGINWQRLTSLRGGSYRMFRVVILANLAPTERISWIDVDYESRFNNKLR